MPVCSFVRTAESEEHVVGDDEVRGAMQLTLPEYVYTQSIWHLVDLGLS